MAGNQIWKVYIYVHIQSFLSIHSGCVVFIGYNEGKDDQYDIYQNLLQCNRKLDPILLHSDQGIRHAADTS